MTPDEVKELVRKWRLEAAGYPAHEPGQFAAAAVRLCAKELESLLARNAERETAVVEHVEPQVCIACGGDGRDWKPGYSCEHCGGSGAKTPEGVAEAERVRSEMLGFVQLAALASAPAFERAYGEDTFRLDTRGLTCRSCGGRFTALIDGQCTNCYGSVT